MDHNDDIVNMLTVLNEGKGLIQFLHLEQILSFRLLLTSSINCQYALAVSGATWVRKPERLCQVAQHKSENTHSMSEASQLALTENLKEQQWKRAHSFQM